MNDDCASTLKESYKLREFKALLRPHTLTMLPSDVEMPPEVGSTFADNALAKARFASELTGKASIADDSGISVTALGGKPGVNSARYAGEGASDSDNLNKLIAECRDLVDRSAEYVCVLALVWPAGLSELFEARCRGELTVEPRGSGGFGYDPIFVPDEIPGEMTMAEITQQQKDEVSHRGRAARMLLEHLSRVKMNG